MSKKINTLLTIIIYFLLIILMSLLIYNLFLLTNNIYHSPDIPKNSIKVGPA